MILIFFIPILTLFTVYNDKFIKRNFTVIAPLATILSATSYFYFDITSIINKGFVGLAFLILVMFTTAFKKGTKLYKKTMLLRKEYSILGFIFIIPHSLLFLIGEFQNLEQNGVISFLIMIPLFITSFIIIRKKMKNETWIKLQTLAYPVYLLTLIHLIIVAEQDHKIIYIVLLFTYVFLKLKNDKFPKLKKYKLGFISVLVIIFILSLNLNNININMKNNSITLEENTYKDGIYYNESLGYKNYIVKVNVEIYNDKIKNIEIIDCGCTSPTKRKDFEAAVHDLKDEIIEKQSTDVDAVSGATKSTKGLLNSVNDVLTEAVIVEQK